MIQLLCAGVHMLISNRNIILVEKNQSRKQKHPDDEGFHGIDTFPLQQTYPCVDERVEN